jgi:hypothetical protein
MTPTISIITVRIANEQNKTSEGAAISYTSCCSSSSCSPASIFTSPTAEAETDQWLHPRLSGKNWFPQSFGGERGGLRPNAFCYHQLHLLPPVLLIIITSFKLQNEALAVPPRFSHIPVWSDSELHLTYAGTMPPWLARAMTAGAAARTPALTAINSIVIASVQAFLALVIGTLAAFASRVTR